MNILQTPRLTLREIIPEDAPFILHLLNTESFIRFIGHRNVNNLEDAREFIEKKFISSYKDHGFGFYLVELKDGSVPIGICGLVKRDWLNDVDFGFALLPDFESMGYGFESSAALLEYAIDKLNLPRIAAITVPDNNRSIKLLKKLGMKDGGTIMHPEESKELLLFLYASQNQIGGQTS